MVQRRLTVYTYTYDNANLVSTMIEPGASSALVTLTYLHDGGGYYTSMADSFGGSATSSFGGNGLLTQRNMSGLSASYSYDGAGRMTSETRSNGSTTTDLYDASGMVTQMTTTTSGSNLVNQYVYDNAGRVQNQTVNDGSATVTVYGYLADGAVYSQKVGGNPTTTYGYDAAGNRNSDSGHPTITYTIGAGNQLTKDAVNNYFYDADGNVTGITPISSGITWAYNLDPQGEYIRYTSANDLITYSLDAYGNLVNRNETLSGVTANVQFEQNGIDSSKPGAHNNENYNAWADVTSGGSIQTRRMFGPGFDNPEVAVGSTTNWYVKDHQNTVQALLNGSDAATWIGAMDAFGVSTGVAVVDNYGFTGKYTDFGTGLVVTHRDGQSPYNALTGKFMAEDPIRLASGQNNWQVYVGNSPTNGTDPSGNWLLVQKGDEQSWHRFFKSHSIHNNGGIVTNDGADFSALFIHPSDQEKMKQALVEDYRWSTASAELAATSASYATGDQQDRNSMVGSVFSRDYLWFRKSSDITPDQKAQIADFSSQSRASILVARENDAGTANFNPGEFKSSNEAARSAAVEGVVGGFKVLSNELTFHQIDSLDKEAQDLIAKEPVYQASQIAGVVVREIGVTIATGGAGSLIGAGGRAIGKIAISQVPNAVRASCAVNTGVKVLMVGNMMYSSAAALQHAVKAVDEAYEALTRDPPADPAEVAKKLTDAGIETAQAASTVGGLLKLAKQIGKEGFRNFFISCFAAGTPIRTPEGWKAIEEIKQGDLVLSREEKDFAGSIVPKIVTNAFSRLGHIWVLRVGGAEVRTTAEHPFYAEGRGWVSAGELQVGERLACEDGSWQEIEELYDAKEIVAVYNFSVEDFHTYFVGTESQAFWVHNSGNNLGLPGCDGGLPTGGESGNKPAEPSSGKVAPAPKEVIIDGGKHPESARHAQDSIDNGVNPGGIVDRGAAKPRRNERMKTEPRVPGKDRDEFPPAVLDNGSGAHSVRPIAPGDNRGAGSSIGHQLDGVPDGTPIVIKPINVPPKKP